MFCSFLILSFELKFWVGFILCSLLLCSGYQLIGSHSGVSFAGGQRYLFVFNSGVISIICSYPMAILPFKNTVSVFLQKDTFGWMFKWVQRILWGFWSPAGFFWAVFMQQHSLLVDLLLLLSSIPLYESVRFFVLHVDIWSVFSFGCRG